MGGTFQPSSFHFLGDGIINFMEPLFLLLPHLGKRRPPLSPFPFLLLLRARVSYYYM